MILWESCVLWLDYPIQNGVWPDVSKQDNDGVCIGARWEEDSIAFDGINDRVNCGNHTSLDIGYRITLEALAKPKEYHSGYLICRNASNDSKRLYGLYVRSGLGQIDFFYWDGAKRSVNWTSLPILYEWTHYAITVEGTTATLYLNGVFQGNRTLNSPFHAGSTAHVQLGCRNPNNFFFSGDIKLVRVYNKALTAAQIKESFQQTYKLV